MKCKKGLEVEVLKSPVGYYKGTCDGPFPNCRLTTGYAKTKEEAEKLPLDRMCAMENQFCNCNGRCFE